jgi:ATP-binding cassette, subfamily B, bacterial
MKTEERTSRVFSPVGVEARYPAPKAWIHPDKSKGWIRRMWPIVWSHRRTFLLAWTGMLLSVGFALLVPLVVRDAVNTANDAVTTGAGAQGLSMILPLVILLGVLALARFVAGFVSRYNMMSSAYGIEYDMRSIIYEHLTRMSFAFYDRVQSGQLISRANSDIRSVQMLLAFGPTMIIQFLTFFVAIGVMIAIHPLLTLVAVLPMPLVWLVGMRMRSLMFPISWIVQARLAEVATLVEENITGVRIVKSFAAELQQIKSLATGARRAQWAHVKQIDVRATYAPILQALPQLGLVFVLFYSGYLVIGGQLDLGAILLFSSYIVFLTTPFRMLGFMLMLSARARASAQRIYEILDEKPEVKDSPGATDLADVTGEVTFDNVTFSYRGGPNVLEDFSLRMEPGETVALVGRTGCGKSTVARLLMRFYDVTDGSVRVDGTDVRSVTQESLRSHIGLVADDAFLFSDSIRNNIAFGRPDADLADVESAAASAGASEFITNLPEGYETIIGERGYDLSGGQRQRVSIARLLVTDPEILILDDATSSVDVQIELEIHSALHRAMEGRTTLVIAHRLSTIRLADRVVLMDQGRLIASGTHAELMATEPRYAEVLAHLEEDEEALKKRKEEAQGNGSGAPRRAPVMPSTPPMGGPQDPFGSGGQF